MSWLRNIATQRVVPSMRRHEDPSRVRAIVSQGPVPHVQAQHNGFTYEEAFKTKLEVSTIWYANQAQFMGGERQRIAERALTEMVFEPYTKYRRRLLHAVMDRDTEEAVRLLDLIDKEIGLD
jgi:hypothetical protein